MKNPLTLRWLGKLPGPLALLICIPALVWAYLPTEPGPNPPASPSNRYVREASVIGMHEPLSSASLPGSLLPIGQVKEEEIPVRGIDDGAFYDQGKRIMLAGGSLQEYMEFWDAKSGRLLQTLDAIELKERLYPGIADDDKSLDIMFWCATITPDGTRAFIGGLKPSALDVFDVPHKRLLPDWGGDTQWEYGGIHAMAVSPDGKYLLVSTYDALELRSIATGRRVRILYRSAGKEQGITAVAFSSDGHSVLAADDNLVVLLDAGTGKVLRRFSDSPPYKPWTIWCVAFSPDGKYLLTVGYNVARLWNRRSGQLVREIRPTPAADHMSQATFTPDGKQLVTNGDYISVWDVQTGREVRQFPKPKFKYGFGKVVVSPDGKYVLSVNPYVCLWRLATGECVRTFK